ncbi:MAG: DUF1214 domain-containing protein [Campylobacterota bacterium]|nr:DUF1214 domain-containing protein [Campylobacterota bacterium]
MKTNIPTLLSGLCLGAALTMMPAMAEQQGGEPLPGMTQTVKDLEAQVYYQRAFEATVWSIPATAIYRLREGFLAIDGVEDNTIVAYSAPFTSAQLAVTANTATPYITAYTDLRKGPAVLEVPAKTDKASLYGQVVDAWQVTIADVGPSGKDAGKGGKYLFLPPGYEGDIPKGYIIVKSPSNRIGFAFRSVKAPGATIADAYAYSKTLKMYFLNDPKPTKYVDPIKEPVYTLPYYDFRTLEDIKAIIDAEPVRDLDKVMMGMLSTIGIEKGKPFNPTPEQKEAMVKGVVDAYHYMVKKTDEMHKKHYYWEDRKWSFVMNPDAKDGFEFITGNELQIDKRAVAWHFFTFYPTTLGKTPATVYLAPMEDSEGNDIQANKTYKIHIPKNMPVKQFWSITVYDHATWGFIDSPLKRPGLGMFDMENMNVNKDGSVDIYVGPKAPKGYESNWIPTMDKQPYIWLRLYGGDTAFWDKSFKMPDLELVK